MFKNPHPLLYILLAIVSSFSLQAYSPNFIENKQQFDEKVHFYTTLNNGALFFEANALTFVQKDQAQLEAQKNASTATSEINYHAYRISFLNSQAEKVIVEGQQSLGAVHHYFLGNDPSKWSKDVALYKKIHYQDLYPQIDLSIERIGTDLKYDFILQAGANPEDIQLAYDGVDAICLQDGDLIAETSVDRLLDLKPICYQTIEERKIDIPCQYVLVGNKLSFDFPNDYNPALPLVIDPILIASTFAGASDQAEGHTATYDSAGNLLVAGEIFSESYPTTLGAYQQNFAGTKDIVISEFSADGIDLIYATFLGGNQIEEPHSLVTDANDNLFLLGRTASTDFPKHPDGFDDTQNGSTDIVVTKLSSDGSDLLGATFIGGSSNDGEVTSSVLASNYGDDGRGEIIVDESGNCYIASCTRSADLPITTNNFQSGFSKLQDAFVCKLNSNLSQMIWGTYLGGEGDDAAYSLRLASDGSLFVGGSTSSQDFPTAGAVLNNSYQGGRSDGFVSHISADGKDLITSSFIGTNAYDQVFLIDLDSNDDVYVFGQTEGNFPLSPNTYRVEQSGTFIASLPKDLSKYVFSTTLGIGSNFSGQNGELIPSAFRVGDCFNIYGAAHTQSKSANSPISGLPVTSDAYQSDLKGIGDMYIFVLAPGASDLSYATYFGGDGWEHCLGGTNHFDENGFLYHAMSTNSAASLPTTDFAYATSSNNTSYTMAAFIFDCFPATTKADVNITPTSLTGCAPFAVSFNANPGVGVDILDWDFGDASPKTIANTQADPLHIFVEEGNYQVRLIGRDEFGCLEADTSETNIMVLPQEKLDAQFEYIISDNCESNTVKFVNTTFGSDQSFWDFGNGQTSTENTVNYVTSFGDDATEITLIASSSIGTCIENDTTTQSIVLTGAAYTSSRFEASNGCAPHTIDLSSADEDAQVYLWMIDGQSFLTKDVSFTFEEAGMYDIELITVDSTSCNFSDTTSQSIEVVNPFEADFTTPDSGFIGEEILFSGPDVPNATYAWDFGDGNTANEAMPAYTYTEAGVYTICLDMAVDSLCQSSSCKDLTVTSDIAFDIPKAFSPNGDGVNDILRIRGNGFTGGEFSIFNRQGKRVFYTTDLKEGWDGSLETREQGIEVFIYILIADLKNGQRITRKGDITLIR